MKNPFRMRSHRTCMIFLLLSTFVGDSYVHKNLRQIRQSSFDSEYNIRVFLCGQYEQHATHLCNKLVEAEWAHSTDLCDKKKADAAINASIERAKFDADFYNSYMKDVDVDDIENLDIARQVKKIQNVGFGALNRELLEELTKILNGMQQIYSAALICPYKKPKCNISSEGIALNPDIENVMANSFDYDELLYTWIAWHDSTGSKIRRPYEFYVVLANEAATANNFSDRGHMWRDEYEMENFEGLVDRLWNEVEPLYSELHEFVRQSIYEFYSKDISIEDRSDGAIPAHLLGNMWAQNWINIKSLVMPFPNATYIDMDEIFQKKNITVTKMFDMANKFFTSMGLESMEEAYNPAKGAILEKPKDKIIVCHASAWDFCQGNKFRVKMCARNTFEDFITIHHELGHIQYYMWYKNQPILYREGANPSFHEAIGDMLALSVFSAKHLKKVHLLDADIDKQQQVNLMMELALLKVAFLPYGYLLDKWRWDIFAEKIDPDKWNDHYWYYRFKYQRVKPPIVRTDLDFDPGAKYHVAADSQYISYFVAHILEFQIHRALCGNDIEPYECDLQDNLHAGRKLKHALKMGASKHWTYILKSLTGTTKISAEALLRYFRPLHSFLQQANRINREKLEARI